MIGFNGGLIGQNRPYQFAGSNPGVWTLDEAMTAEQLVRASGGAESDIVDSNDGLNYRLHQFTTVGSNTFTVTSAGEVEYFMIGGGSGGNCGQGGSHFGNGGAAGIVKTGRIYLAAQAYTVTVGSGSNGVAQTSSAAGGSSSAFGITATGGNGVSNTLRVGGSNATFSGGTGDGFNGGGGAGAAQAGTARNAGDGYASAITGSIVGRGGGGGGGGAAILSNNGFGAGFGGGGGSFSGGGGGGNATANTGSGGGGGSPDNAGTTGGNGGSGIVIVRYLKV
jgi:hypothetical protein